MHFSVIIIPIFVNLTFEETSQFQEAPSLSKKTNTNGIRYISNYDQFANSLPLSKIKTLRPDE